MRQRPLANRLIIGAGCLAAALLAGPRGAAAEPAYRHLGNAADPGPGPDDLDPRLEFMFGATACADDDMDATYGIVPEAGAGLVLAAGRVTSFLLRVCVQTRAGNPYHGTSAFTTDRDSRVTAVPITLGFRWNLARHQRFRFHMGTAFNFGWVRERLPSADRPEQDYVANEAGWGLAVFMGPEVLLDRGRRSLGLEVGWGGIEANWLMDDHSDTRTNLTGLQARLSYAFALAAGKEGTR